MGAPPNPNQPPAVQMISQLLPIMLIVFILIVLIVNIVVCLLLYNCYKLIPGQFRKQDPTLVWLLMIPCFQFVWNFFVFPQLSDSYKAYFHSIGRADVGDCGRGIGLAYAVLSVFCIIPYIGCLISIPVLVLLIISLVKIDRLKNQLPPA